MGRRTGLSTVLILGAFVLLIAIAVGMNMGNRVLGQIGVHVPVQPTAVPPVTPPPDDTPPNVHSLDLARTNRAIALMRRRGCFGQTEPAA